AVIGSGMALEPQDWVFPALRQGGVAVLRGYSLSLLVAQNMGNSRDILKGRQMPCHYSDRSVNQVSWSSVIATQIPHAVGAAYAARYRGDKVVCIAYLGDGATSESDFHVACNFAGVWKAPVVLFCQNNQWAISVPFRSQTASDGVAVKSEAYGMPGVRVDGNDILAVYRVTKEAVDRARRGEGPTLIEAVTYRLGGHSSSDDPTRYREGPEVDEAVKRDPIVRFRRYLEERGLWSTAQEEAAQAEFNDRIGKAISEAEQGGPPPIGTLFDDVYASLPAPLREQREQLKREVEEKHGLGKAEGEFPL
ncbi:MAG: thiamine pyrophosphate-dependent enzyme, partial [Planctomycetota bacterium]